MLWSGSASTVDHAKGSIEKGLVIAGVGVVGRGEAFRQ